MHPTRPAAPPAPRSGTWALALTVLLAIVYTFPVLFLGETYFFRDLYQHYLPQRVTVATELAAGEVPLWDPYVHGGWPLLAAPDNLALYPSTLLYLLLPPWIALNLEVALHLILAMVSTWLLARAFGLSPPAALAAAALLGLSGVTLSLVNLLNRFFTLALAPLLLLAWHRLMVTGRRRWLAASLVVGLVVFSAGGGETLAVVLLTLAVLTLVHPYERRPLVAKLALLATLPVLLVGLDAVQLLPTAELTSQSVRSAGLGEAARLDWSLSPRRLPELVLPGFMGRVDTLAAGDFWGAQVQDQHFPYILSIYLGALALLLAGAGLVARGSPGLPRRTRAALAALAVLAVLLALGRHVPGLRLLWALPGVDLFRFPVKTVVLGVLPVALLAGAGLDAAASAGRARRLAVGLAAMAGSLAIAAALLWLAPALARKVEDLVFSVHGARVTLGLLRAVLHPAVVLALAAVALVLRWPAARGWGLAGVLAADLLVAGLPVNPHAPRALFEAVPPLAQLARQEIDDGRLYRDVEATRTVLRAPANEVVYQDLWNRDVLNFYLGAAFQLPVIFHEDYDRLASHRIVALGKAVWRSGWERRQTLLSAASVSLVVTQHPPPLPGLASLAGVPSFGSRPTYLYRNPAAVPRARFVSRAVPAGDQVAALAAMLNAGYDPATEAVIEGAPRTTDQPATSAGPAVSVSRLGTAHASYRVHAPCEGYLVLGDPWYPGWRVRVDGRRATLLHADVAFAAVALAPGDHVVEQRYWPQSFVDGARCSLVFVLLAGLALASRAIAGLGRGPGELGAL